ncbi:RyR domain-containing protein [Planctomycetota bacterium]
MVDSSTWLRNQLKDYVVPAKSKAGRSEHQIYQAYQKLLASILERAKKLYSPMALIQARAKAPASLAEKCLRKQHKYKRPIFQLTDLCGARLVVDSLSDVRSVCKFIRESFIIDEENSEDKIALIQPDVFGYIAVHYVVQLPADLEERLVLSKTEQDWLNVVRTRRSGIPAGGRKAEIQIQTQLQHAWAQMFHDRTYKTAVTLPRELKREASRLAAVLEDTDRECTALMSRIDQFDVNYGAYMDREQMRRQMESAEHLLTMANDPKLKIKMDRLSLVLRIISMAKVLGEWQTIMTLGQKYGRRNPDNAGPANRIYIEYGYALCKAHEHERMGQAYERGQSILSKTALAHDNDSSDKEYPNPQTMYRAISDMKGVEGNETRALALAYLGWSYERQGQYVPARASYHLAHLYDYSNPYYFRGMLDCGIAMGQPLDLRAFDSQIAHYLKTCAEHARAKIELPYAYFTSAKFNLYLNRLHDSLLDYTRAVILSNNSYPIEEELLSVHQLLQHCSMEVGLEHPSLNLTANLKLVQRFLVIARLAKMIQVRSQGKLPAGERRKLDREIKRSYSDSGVVWHGHDCSADSSGNLVVAEQQRMVIVAGGSDPRLDAYLRVYDSVLGEAFDGFSGIAFCGGTKSGVPGMLGQIAGRQKKKRNRDFRLIGYIPDTNVLPQDAPLDQDNYELITDKNSKHFSYSQPLLNWTDILSQGVEPQRVRLLGVNGGDITEFEYYLALAMGATVGLIAGSGRKAAVIIKDRGIADTGQLFELPNDPMTIRAHLLITSTDWRPENITEAAAKEVHKVYCELSAKTPDQTWKDSPEDFKNSCYHQVAYAASILRTAGLTVKKKTSEGKRLDTMKFKTTAKQLDKLAQMEHGRWVVERLMQGWTYGKNKSEELKTSPYLVEWNSPSLPDDIKEYDLQFVRHFSRVLEKNGDAVFK